MVRPSFLPLATISPSLTHQNLLPSPLISTYHFPPRPSLFSPLALRLRPSALRPSRPLRPSSPQEHDLSVAKTAQGQHLHQSENLAFKVARLEEDLSFAHIHNDALQELVKDFNAEDDTRDSTIGTLIAEKNQQFMDLVDLQIQAESLP